MNISHEKVLQKMEKEIAAAKQAGPSELGQHVYAIKSMCDLLMGLEGPVSAPTASPVPVHPVVSHPVSQPVQAALQPDRITTEDGSNGESIFDF